MKLIIKSITLLALASCASYQNKVSDQAEKVCSSKSYEYLTQNLELVQNKKLTVVKGGPILNKLSSEINKCMIAEAIKTRKTGRKEFCLVAGFDRYGQREFFEFSSKISPHSWQLTECLNSLKNSEEFNGLKDAVIYTPLEFIY